ncbi:MAG: hypothetical protein ACRDV0_05040 [Acidimicrobiales bacterium]
MNRSKSLGVAVASVLLGGAVIAGAGVWLASAAPHQASLACVPNSSTNSCDLKIATFPDSLEGVHGANGGPHPDWVTYSNDNLVVPANTTINVTIDQYDSGGPLNNYYLGNVIGTIGGTAIVNGKTVTHVDPTNVGHTFTLRNIPGNGSSLLVSVPRPADLNSKFPVKIGIGDYPKPVVVQFSFKTGSKGVYEWNCEFPCGSSREGQFGFAMSSYGYMSGTLTVQ